MKILLIGNILITIFLHLVFTQSTSKELREPPTRNGPVVVSIGIYVQGLHEINEKTMDYTVIMYYRESWKDTRVSHGKGSTLVHRNDLKKFWLPDIFLRNEKFAATHNVMTENRLLRIGHDGKFWHIRKISATLPCPMKFHKYPFDVQVCPMVFESFGYMTNTLVLSWLDNPVEFSGSTTVPYFLFETSLKNCSHTYSIGGFPCLEIQIFLKRSLTSYVIEFFLPTIFLVVVAWMTFWIDLRSTTHRIAVSSTALFLVCVLHERIRKNLPTLSYLTAADIWTIICCVHVSYTIIVHIIVNFMLNVVPKTHHVDSGSEKVTLDNPDKHQKKEKIISGLKSLVLGERFVIIKDVDKCLQDMQLFNALSRVIVALHFLLVLIAYFCFYTSSSYINA